MYINPYTRQSPYTNSHQPFKPTTPSHIHYLYQSKHRQPFKASTLHPYTPHTPKAINHPKSRGTGNNDDRQMKLRHHDLSFMTNTANHSKKAPYIMFAIHINPYPPHTPIAINHSKRPPQVMWHRKQRWQADDVETSWFIIHEFTLLSRVIVDLSEENKTIRFGRGEDSQFMKRLVGERGW